MVTIIFLRIGGSTKQDETGETGLGTGQNIYLKLYDKLPTEIVAKQRAWIAQEDKRPLIESVNVYAKVEDVKVNTLKGPNFDVDTEYAVQTLIILLNIVLQNNV